MNKNDDDSGMKVKKIFISHAHEDAELAVLLKDLIENAFAGNVEAFVSSDLRSLGYKEDWLKAIADNLRNANEFIILLTPTSIRKSWVHFEAGAAFGRDVDFFVVCASGIQVENVEPPLNSRQLLVIEETGDIEKLIQQIADNKFKPKLNKKLINQIAKLAVRTDSYPPPLSADAKTKEAYELSQVIEEWEEKGDIETRQIFWETARKYYAAICKSVKGYPSTLQALLELSNPPDGIPVAIDEDLRDYPFKGGRFLKDNDSLLYQFCELIYPPRKDDKSLSELSVLSLEDFDKFHKARQVLSKQWNRIAATVYEKRSLDIKTVEKYFDAHRHMLLFLTYLEIPLQHFTQNIGRGKLYMFCLNRDWKI